MTNQTQARTTAVIFDFDGTIADSFDLFVELLELVLKLPEPIPQEKITQLRGLPMKDSIKTFGIKRWQVPRLVLKGRQLVTSRIDEVLVFDGMPEVIKALSAEGFQIFILSTNGEAAIKQFMERHKLSRYITRCYAGTSIGGKAARTKKLMKREKLSAENCVYVGDEVRDVEAAKKAGMPVVAVGWGYNTPAVLKLANPDKLVHTPESLLKAIMSPAK